MKFYAVYDTNVLVSSLLTQKENSATALVVDAMLSGEIIPLYNQEILDEYEEVLRRKKFAFSETNIRKLIKVVRQFGVEVEASPTGEIFSDMDDLVFYEVMMEKRKNEAYLITGNKKHFPYRTYIVTPSEMMDILSGKF